MHALSAWFTRNPVAANLLMILVLIAGLFTLFSIRIEGFPAMPENSLTVETTYPGWKLICCKLSHTRAAPFVWPGLVDV